MTSNENYKLINLEYINEIADGENEFIIEIITKYIEVVGPTVEKLEQAINNNDSENAAFNAHKLKGSFGFVGCEDLANAAGIVEQYATEHQLQDTVEHLQKIKDEYPKTIQELNQVLSTLE